MDDYQIELQSGGIQFRDKWQFELKSELYLLSEKKENVQTQEFYIFVPNSLQINDQTYTKTQFYQDQTNLIRFKTPNFSLQELTDKDNSESPLVRILLITDCAHTTENEESLQNELKLLGDIFNSCIRDTILEFAYRLDHLKQSDNKFRFIEDVNHFCDQLENFRLKFKEIEERSLALWKNQVLHDQFEYIDEFISLMIHDHLCNFLNRLRFKSFSELQAVEKRFSAIVLKEQQYRKEVLREKESTGDHEHDEYILYRKGLLNKFVIDPLLLKTNRASVDQRYRNIIGGIPAAVAMTLYLLLFIWQGNVFLMNSEPFILLTVVIYVLKDRLKEELRYISYRQAAKWFSDYTTEIHSNGTDLGTLREYFSFVEESDISKEIINIRNREFHGVLEAFKRPEQVLYYKKTVNIKKKPKMVETRFFGLSIIFRFNIHQFLTKAEDPYQSYYYLDEDQLKKMKLPRVYHINIIMKTTQVLPNGSTNVFFEKYRLVIDKSGIKRVEHV